MKTPKHSLFLKTAKFIPKTIPITWNYVSQYVQPISWCSTQLPADTSITHLHLSISLPCFKKQLPAQCPLFALSKQSLCSHLLATRRTTAPNTTVVAQCQLDFWGQVKPLALIPIGTESSWPPTYFTGPLRRLMLPFTHLLIYIPRDIPEEVFLWDITVLWPVFATFM